MVSRHFTWKSNFIIILDHFSGIIPTCWGRPIMFSCQNGCRFFLEFDTFQRKHEWSQLRCKMVTAVASCGSISQTDAPTISGWNGPWAGRWLLDLKMVVQKLQTQGKDMKKMSLVVVGCCWYVSMQFSDVQFRTILHQTVLFKTWCFSGCVLKTNKKSQPCDLCCTDSQLRIANCSIITYNSAWQALQMTFQYVSVFFL